MEENISYLYLASKVYCGKIKRKDNLKLLTVREVNERPFKPRTTCRMARGVS